MQMLRDIESLCANVERLVRSTRRRREGMLGLCGHGVVCGVRHAESGAATRNRKRLFGGCCRAREIEFGYNELSGSDRRENRVLGEGVHRATTNISRKRKRVARPISLLPRTKKRKEGSSESESDNDGDASASSSDDDDKPKRKQGSAAKAKKPSRRNRRRK